MFQLWRVRKQSTQAVAPLVPDSIPRTEPKQSKQQTKGEAYDSTGRSRPSPTDDPALRVFLDAGPPHVAYEAHICPCRHTSAGPSCGRASAALRPPPRGRKGTRKAWHNARKRKWQLEASSEKHRILSKSIGSVIHRIQRDDLDRPHSFLNNRLKLNQNYRRECLLHSPRHTWFVSTCRVFGACESVLFRPGTLCESDEIASVELVVCKLSCASASRCGYSRGVFAASGRCRRRGRVAKRSGQSTTAPPTLQTRRDVSALLQAIDVIINKNYQSSRLDNVHMHRMKLEPLFLSRKTSLEYRKRKIVYRVKI
ncbi:unnamed protein product [Trichogramma brassicae]|uniref:Uncharacterized protein n=1 Tax=Trichogramma brassicae TaxID=86971 RepID=A0A6H5I179_9HYME|nr:unnamed protein product [Trichogramma brassicae]